MTRFASLLFVFSLITLTTPGCDRRHDSNASAVTTTPTTNRLTLSIDGGPEMAWEGPTELDAMNETSLSASINERWLGSSEHGYVVHLSYPNNSEGVFEHLQFFIGSLDRESPNTSHIGEVADYYISHNLPVESPTFWKGVGPFNKLTHRFAIQHNPTTGFYDGEFNINFCAYGAYESGRCKLPENQRKVIGTFRIKANLDPPSTLPKPPLEHQGTLTVPIDLNGAPYLSRQLNTRHTRQNNQRYSYFSLSVQPNIRYVFDAWTNFNEYETTDLVPFRVFSDAEFTQELCASTRAPSANTCTTSTPGNRVYIRVDPLSTNLYQVYGFSIYQDSTELPTQSPLDTWLSKTIESPITDVVDAKVKFYKLATTPTQTYTVSMESTDPSNFEIGELTVLPEFPPPDTSKSCFQYSTGTESCTLVFSTPQICHSRDSQPTCSFKSSGNSVFVAVKAHAWAGGLPFRINLIEGGKSYSDQGTFINPFPLGNAPIVNYEGQFGNAGSVYSINVTPGEIYRLTYTNADEQNPLNYFYTNVYDSDEFYQSAFDCMWAGSSCLWEPRENMTILNVIPYSGAYPNGSTFNLSLVPVSSDYRSESKTLNLDSLPYQGQTGPRGSTYILDVDPNTPYRVLTTQPFGFFPSLQFSATDPNKPEVDLCRSSYFNYKSQECVFRSTPTMKQVSLKIGIGDMQFAEIQTAGSPFTLTVAKSDDLTIPTSEGTNIPQEIALNAIYDGHASITPSHYFVAVQPQRLYRISVINTTAGIYLNSDVCSTIPHSLFGYSNSDCLVLTSEDQTSILIDIYASGAQSANYSIIVAEEPQ